MDVLIGEESIQPKKLEGRSYSVSSLKETFLVFLMDYCSYTTHMMQFKSEVSFGQEKLERMAVI